MLCCIDHIAVILADCCDNAELALWKKQKDVDLHLKWRNITLKSSCSLIFANLPASSSVNSKMLERPWSNPRSASSDVSGFLEPRPNVVIRIQLFSFANIFRIQRKVFSALAPANTTKEFYKYQRLLKPLSSEFKFSLLPTFSEFKEKSSLLWLRLILQRSFTNVSGFFETVVIRIQIFSSDKIFRISKKSLLRD